MKAVVVHGGSGKLRKHKVDRAKRGVKEAAAAAYKALLSGKTALDACEIGVKALEDNPVFNAGTGAVLTLDGRCELDAAIIVGSTLSAGAVGGVENIKNPISLARKVMEETDHVLLVGEGAKRFATLMGFEEYNPVTEERLAEWKELREKLLMGESYKWHKIAELIRRFPELLSGTVGCVVLDDKGEIVAGTSTGGVFLKLLGRVGDTPMIGAGTYATSFAGASATGIGEGIMRVVLAKTVTDLIQDGVPPKAAAQAGIDMLTKQVGLSAGVIALDREGEIGFSKNTENMPVAYIRDGMSEVEVVI